MLLTKAIGALPQTHPLSILAPRCDELAGGKGGEKATACRGRLGAWLDRQLSHDDIVLNATATFRAPRAARGRLYEAPFLFNVECAALLCAYTRLLTRAPPHATRQLLLKCTCAVRAGIALETVDGAAPWSTLAVARPSATSSSVPVCNLFNLHGGGG